MRNPRRPSAIAELTPSGVVLPLPSVRDDIALVKGLRAGEAWARAAFFDKYAPPVERILRRILGHDRHTEMADLVHDTFVQAIGSIDRLRDPSALLAWMQTIAAYTAHKTIRARRARCWLRFWEPAELPDVPTQGLDPEVAEAYQHTYALLSRFSAAERVAFTLRYIDGMEVNRVAEICGVSLATIKRRLARAERRFVGAAQRDEVLRPWLERGGRWTK
jgi:RNA polymerase sigma-70 factor (ECF subfamily)